MSEMTTQEILAKLGRRSISNKCHLKGDEADAIAARLKALEEALKWYQQKCAELAIPIVTDDCAAIEARTEVSDDAFMDLQLDGGNRARAILDTVRGVDDASA